MNEKKAKSLRRYVRARTIGKPERDYTQDNGVWKNVDGRNVWYPGTIRLAKGCARAVYQSMKRLKKAAGLA